MDQLVEMLWPLISGGKAVHLTVNKGSDGRNVAQELEVEGPITTTIPTIRNGLDAQLQSRMLTAELKDYEGRVAKHSRKVSELLLLSFASEDFSPRIRAWKAALYSLAAVRRVVFPLDREEFCLDRDDISYGARLWANLLGLMCTHAWLEQHNRDILTLNNGEAAIVATPEDYTAAYEIFEETCERSVVNICDTHRKILDALYELREEERNPFVGFSQKQISEKSGLPRSTVGDNRAFVAKSLKWVWEPEGGGLALVHDADPSWWEKGDVLVGFPRPEEVRCWWDEDE
jgi:hypothetical protein